MIQSLKTKMNENFIGKLYKVSTKFMYTILFDKQEQLFSENLTHLRLVLFVDNVIINSF